jgi:hypothetical protein
MALIGCNCLSPKTLFREIAIRKKYRSAVKNAGWVKVEMYLACASLVRKLSRPLYPK